LAGSWAVAVGLLVSLTGAAAGRSIDLGRQLGAIAQGGLGQLALLDQADGVLAEKMDILAKLEGAEIDPNPERTLGSSPLRGLDDERRRPGLARRLHHPVSMLQRALGELESELVGDDTRRRLAQLREATREIHAIGVELAVEEGHGESAHETADLADIVRRGAASFGAGQPESLEIRVDVAVDPAPVRCQPFQLEQVVIQLVMNASEAVHGDGCVGVSLNECPEGYEIAVSDAGDGIDPEILDSLFDPFFAPPVGADAGLGLTICYRIVKQHGGEFSVYSEPGHGTRVAVVLPAST
jgi:signal transduction histidine kinase